MSSRRLASSSSRAGVNATTPTPSFPAGQHTLSDLSDQLTPRLSTRTTTRSGQTPSTSRALARRPAASTSRLRSLVTEGALSASTTDTDGKGNGRAVQVREGGREGAAGRRFTPRAQQSAIQPSTAVRNTRSQSAQSSASEQSQSEPEEASSIASIDEQDEDEDELDVPARPNEHESAFNAAASALLNFYTRSQDGRIDRHTEGLLWSVLNSHKDFLFPPSPPSTTSPSYILPSTFDPASSPYLRASVALANKAILLHSVLLRDDGSEARAEQFEEAWAAFLPVLLADKEEGLQVHDGVLSLLVDMGTQLYIIKHGVGILRTRDRDSLLGELFSSTLLSRRGVLPQGRDGLKSQLQVRWKALIGDRVRKLKATTSLDLPTTFSLFDFERELINFIRARVATRLVDTGLDDEGGQDFRVLLRDDEPLERVVRQPRKSEPAPSLSSFSRLLAASTSKLPRSALRHTTAAASTSSRRRSLPQNLASMPTLRLQPLAPRSSYTLSSPPRRRSSGPRYSVLPIQPEDLSSPEESGGEQLVAQPEVASSSAEDESGCEEAEDEMSALEEEEGEDADAATPKAPRRVVEMEVDEEEEKSSDEEEVLEETEELVGLEADEETGLGVGGDVEMEVEESQDEGEEEVVVPESEEERKASAGPSRRLGDAEEDVPALDDLEEDDWDVILVQAAEADGARLNSDLLSDHQLSLSPSPARGAKGKGSAQPRLPFIPSSPFPDDQNNNNKQDFNDFMDTQPYHPPDSPSAPAPHARSASSSKPLPKYKRRKPLQHLNTFDETQDSTDEEDARAPKPTPQSKRILPEGSGTVWEDPNERRRSNTSQRRGLSMMSSQQLRRSVSVVAEPSSKRHASVSVLDILTIEQQVLAQQNEERRRRKEESRLALSVPRDADDEALEDGHNDDRAGSGGVWSTEETECLLKALMALPPSETQPFASVLDLHGTYGTESQILHRRTNVNCKDKTRNLLHAKYPLNGPTPVPKTLLRYLAKEDPRHVEWLESRNPEVDARWQPKRSGGQSRRRMSYKKAKRAGVAVVDSDDDDQEEEEEDMASAVEGEEEDDDLEEDQEDQGAGMEEEAEEVPEVVVPEVASSSLRRGGRRAVAVAS